MINDMNMGGMIFGGLSSGFIIFSLVLPLIFTILLIWLLISGIKTLSLYREKLNYEIEELESKREEGEKKSQNGSSEEDEGEEEDNNESK